MKTLESLLRVNRLWEGSCDSEALLTWSFSWKLVLKMDYLPADRPLDTRVLHISWRGEQFIFFKNKDTSTSKRKNRHAKTSARDRVHTACFPCIYVKVFFDFTCLTSKLHRVFVIVSMSRHIQAPRQQQDRLNCSRFRDLSTRAHNSSCNRSDELATKSTLEPQGR